VNAISGSADRNSRPTSQRRAARTATASAARPPGAVSGAAAAPGTREAGLPGPAGRRGGGRNGRARGGPSDQLGQRRRVLDGHELEGLDATRRDDRPFARGGVGMPGRVSLQHVRQVRGEGAAVLVAAAPGPWRARAPRPRRRRREAAHEAGRGLRVLVHHPVQDGPEAVGVESATRPGEQVVEDRAQREEVAAASSGRPWACSGDMLTGCRTPGPPP